MFLSTLNYVDILLLGKLANQVRARASPPNRRDRTLTTIAWSAVSKEQRLSPASSLLRHAWAFIDDRDHVIIYEQRKPQFRLSYAIGWPTEAAVHTD
jgi:hypothetical protein